MLHSMEEAYEDIVGPIDSMPSAAPAGWAAEARHP